MVMARVTLNPILDEIRGEMGDQLVFKRDRLGRTILSRKPDFGPDRRFSSSQRAHQDRFRQAAGYAREAAREHPVYTELAQGTARSAYNVALGDWFHPPVVHRVDLSGYTGRAGGTVRVRATDDVRVARVRVTVRAGGSPVEQGEARPEGESGEWYVYRAQADCPVGEVVVAAMAEDLPGHEGAAEAVWET